MRLTRQMKPLARRQLFWDDISTTLDENGISNSSSKWLHLIKIMEHDSRQYGATNQHGTKNSIELQYPRKIFETYQASSFLLPTKIGLTACATRVLWPTRGLAAMCKKT